MNFKKATELVKKLSKSPTNDEKLLIYSLYKQATIGNNYKSKPWLYQIIELEKWKAWNKLKGWDKEEAKNQYIKNVEHLILKYGYSV